MLGSIEYSAEYIRLYNLLSRCKSCRSFRKLNMPAVRKQVLIRQRNGKAVVTIRKIRLGEAWPCIYSCNRFTAEELQMFDVLRFEELRDAYEPPQIDYSEDNAREDACAVPDETGKWVRIVLSSLV